LRCFVGIGITQRRFVVELVHRFSASGVSRFVTPIYLTERFVTSGVSVLDTPLPKVAKHDLSYLSRYFTVSGIHGLGLIYVATSGDAVGILQTPLDRVVIRDPIPLPYFRVVVFILQDAPIQGILC